MSASSPAGTPCTGSDVPSSTDTTAQAREQLKHRAMNGGMAATEGGLAPRASHPGLCEQAHRNIQVEPPSGKEMSITQSRRRYIDPHESAHSNPLYPDRFTHDSNNNKYSSSNNRDNNDNTKENGASALRHVTGQSAASRRVRAEVSPVPQISSAATTAMTAQSLTRARSRDSVSQTAAPRGRSNSLSSSSSHTHTRHVSAEYDMSKTSIERAEARLRALLLQPPAPRSVNNDNNRFDDHSNKGNSNGNGEIGNASSESKSEQSGEMDVCEVAAALLRDYAGDPAIVAAEEKLRHQIAVHAYAAQCRQSCSQTRSSALARGRSLGTVSPALQRSLPYAVDETTASTAAATAPTRSGSRTASEHTTAATALVDDCDTAATHPPYDTVDYYQAKDTSQLSSHALATPTTHSSGDGSHSNDDNSDNNGSMVRQMSVCAGATASTTSLYPDPPAVGLITQRRTLVHIDRSRNVCSVPLCGEDTDTIALKRARSRTPTPPPPMGARCREENKRGTSEKEEKTGDVAPSLRNAVEARWKAREEQQQTQRKGRAYVPHEEHQTRPW